MSARVACEISEGLRPSEVTVFVADVRGKRQFLRVPRDFLTFEGGKWFLPVGVIHDDRRDRKRHSTHVRGKRRAELAAFRRHVYRFTPFTRLKLIFLR